MTGEYSWGWVDEEALKRKIKRDEKRWRTNMNDEERIDLIGYILEMTMELKQLSVDSGHAKLANAFNLVIVQAISDLGPWADEGPPIEDYPVKHNGKEVV